LREVTAVAPKARYRLFGRISPSILLARPETRSVCRLNSAAD
jgi:hypothetical protein